MEAFVSHKVAGYTIAKAYIIYHQHEANAKAPVRDKGTAAGKVRTL